MKSGSGADASDILLGSGSVYTPTLDSLNRAKVVIKATLLDGVTGLKDFSFKVAGGVTVTMEIYGPQGFKFFWDQVSDPYQFVRHGT